MTIIWLFCERARLQRTDGALPQFAIPMRRGRDAAAESAFRALAPLMPRSFLPSAPASE